MSTNIFQWAPIKFLVSMKSFFFLFLSTSSQGLSRVFTVLTICFILLQWFRGWKFPRKSRDFAKVFIALSLALSLWLSVPLEDNVGYNIIIGLWCYVCISQPYGDICWNNIFIQGSFCMSVHIVRGRIAAPSTSKQAHLLLSWVCLWVWLSSCVQLLNSIHMSSQQAQAHAAGFLSSLIHMALLFVSLLHTVVVWDKIPSSTYNSLRPSTCLCLVRSIRKESKKF